MPDVDDEFGGRWLDIRRETPEVEEALRRYLMRKRMKEASDRMRQKHATFIEGLLRSALAGGHDG